MRLVVKELVATNLPPWLRGRASVLFSEGCWFTSPHLHIEVSSGKILIPKLLLMCWSEPCIAAISVRCMFEFIQVALDKSVC